MELGISDTVLDFTLILEVVVLFYLLARRSLSHAVFPFQTAPRKSLPLQLPPEQPLSEVDALNLRRQKLFLELNELRKRYLKGDTDYATYARLAPAYEYELTRLNARLSFLFDQLESASTLVEYVPPKVLVSGLCVKCRAKRIMKNAKHYIMRSRRQAYKGTCPECATLMFKIVKSS